MKKKLTVATLVFLLAISCIRPAFALMIDGSQIAAKVSDYVNKIQDAASKVIQQVNQAKLMTTQGFNLDTLRELAVGFYSTQALQGSNQQMSQVVDGTQARNRIILQDDMEKYSEASQALYEAKIDYVDKNKKQVKEEQNNSKNELQSVKSQRQTACAEYENDKTDTEKFEKCEELKSREATLEANVNELGALYDNLANQQQILSDESGKVGVAGDAVYDALKARLDEMDKTEDNVDIVMASDNTEWEKLEDMSKYQLNEADYQIFLKRYFYDPTQMGNSNRQAFQSNMDRLMRERRYLLVNSAAHLLQVSATVRREIPIRTAAIEKMFKNTPSSSSELEAMSSYSATRIENARVLLLYAKLLSAKIQYMAARDLLDIEPQKISTGKTYAGFDLGKYILTDEYVEKVVKESNQTIDYSKIEEKHSKGQK